MIANIEVPFALQRNRAHHRRQAFTAGDRRLDLWQAIRRNLGEHPQIRPPFTTQLVEQSAGNPDAPGGFRGPRRCPAQL